MRRFLFLLCIFGPSLVIALSIWTVRSIRASADQVVNSPARVVLPAGTRIRIRLVGELSSETKSGDIMQAIIADTVMAGTYPAVPAEARGFVRVLSVEKHPRDEGKVTLRLLSLMAQNRTVPLHSSPLTTDLKRASDLSLMGRAASELIGGALGAAAGAEIARNPSVGAGAVGEFAAGPATEDTDKDALVFKLLDPIDVTGLKW
ncbi:MAG TPA: hypothetical protein VGK48_25305 [Terriglobia bacterium]|jgi:hypothetical protein